MLVTGALWLRLLKTTSWCKENTFFGRLVEKSEDGKETPLCGDRWKILPGENIVYFTGNFIIILQLKKIACMEN